jgi:hypothetical protein
VDPDQTGLLVDLFSHVGLEIIALAEHLGEAGDGGGPC